MIKAAIEKILEMAQPHTYTEPEVNRVYSDKKMEPLKTPKSEGLGIHTLAGIVEYIKKVDLNIKANHRIVISSPTTVGVMGNLKLQDMTRNIYCGATYEQATQINERERSIESFIIWVQTNFVQEANAKGLLAMLGNVRAEKVKTSQDDGISQVVSQRVGPALSSTVKIKNPIFLVPRRTFPEVDQPSSPFVVRLHQDDDDDLPTVSLHECDNGAWKLAAIENIRQYFKKELPEVPVLA